VVLALPPVNLLSLKWLGLTLASFIVVVERLVFVLVLLLVIEMYLCLVAKANACSESELVVIKLRLNLRKYALTLLGC